MTDSTEWQDTRQLDTPVEKADARAAATAAAHAETARDSDFVHTEPLPRDELDPRWWSEAADGQCSEEAALFAASQPAPLSIV